MKKLFLFLGVLFVFTVATTFAEDSDLVKLAKQEKERRAKTQAKKTLTNQDIEEIRKKQPITGIENTSEEQTQPAEGTETKATAKDTPKPADTNTEQYWRSRKQQVDQQLQDAQSKVQQLQTEVTQLQTAFYAESDGVGQRPVIKQEWDERLKALEQAKQDLQAAQNQSDGLEDEARRAGALPGWVRD
jgi:hypothetical protein